MTATATDDRTTSGERVVLAAASAPAHDDAPRTRDTVIGVGVIAVMLVGLVALVGSLVIRRLAEQQAVHDVAELTDVLARSVVQPAITDAMTDDPALATKVLDPIVRDGDLASSLVRVKVWTPQGRVIYSDDPRITGRTFPLDDEGRDALTGARIEADVSDLDRPENRFERGQGTLLEVYRPIWTPHGRPLLLETYFRYDTVQSRSSGLWRGFAGIMISSVVALLVLLIPLVAFLLRRIRRAHEQRRVMAQRAVEASDEERRRIGASLHDGAVQQLVAASFDLAGRAERASNSGDGEGARALADAATTVRGTIGELRSLLVEIHPPSLGAAGLAAALADLASTHGADFDVVLDVDDDATAQLSEDLQEEVFRVVRECLRNAAKHSAATTVEVSVRPLDPQHVRVEIADDGTGFDAAASVASAEHGHFGLQLLAEAARRCGAELSVVSHSGHGTRYRMDVSTA